MSKEPKLPRRRFWLKLKVEADTLDDLIGFLRGFETELYMGKVSNGVTGGYSAGAVYNFNEDDTITHESWAEANEAYVNWMRERDKAAP